MARLTQTGEVVLRGLRAGTSTDSAVTLAQLNDFEGGGGTYTATYLDDAVSKSIVDDECVLYRPATGVPQIYQNTSGTTQTTIDNGNFDPTDTATWTLVRTIEFNDFWIDREDGRMAAWANDSWFQVGGDPINPNFIYDMGLFSAPNNFDLDFGTFDMPRGPDLNLGSFFLRGTVPPQEA